MLSLPPGRYRGPIARAVVLAALGVGVLAPGAMASSHSEAPLISQDPRADNTDLYAFVSPDRPDTVTIVDNYIPLEAPAAGPNFYGFDDSVRYEIHVKSGDAGDNDETTYRFRFNTATRNPNTFLYNTGPIDSNDDADFNRPQTYTVTRVRGITSKVLGRDLPVPPANVGPRSTPEYDALAQAAVSDQPGGIKVFAGPRDDPFFVDLGSIFDLAGLRPFNSLHAIPLGNSAGVDAVADHNVHSIVIQIPTTQLTRPGKPTIGVYASASRQRVRVLREDGSSAGSGDWVQVSRLGEPLINEAVIPLGQKDLWNRTDPEDDSQFASLYRSPEVTKLENGLYAALDNADESGRDDLVAILLTGIPGVNSTGDSKQDLLRLNTSIPPSAPVGHGDRLGALSGDLAGFPNGRRLEDDIVDIDLRAFAQGYGPFLHGALGLPDRSPNDLLGDGVDANDKAFSTTFPYVAAPFQGYQVP